MDPQPKARLVINIHFHMLICIVQKVMFDTLDIINLDHDTTEQGSETSQKWLLEESVCQCHRVLRNPLILHQFHT